MKGFLEEYGLIIVVVAVILLMLAFAKTGLATKLQESITSIVEKLLSTGESYLPGAQQAGGLLF